MSKPGKLFCFGLGYTALHLARRLREDGWTIEGTCRSEEQQRSLKVQGFAAHLFERGRPIADPESAFHDATHILSSVPPDAQGDPVFDEHGTEVAHVLRLQWFGYLSTTGVYGDRGGDWVDEDSDLKPTGERGLRRLTAEADWRHLWLNASLPLHIFRLAGIYGSGRSAIDSLRDGTAKRIVKPGQVFSRIHVDDIATVLIASMVQPDPGDPGAVYNVCDDNPAPPDEVVAYAAQLLGVEPPPAVPFEEAKLSAMARSFYADNKRVRNDRMKEELGVQLKYPDYRNGLQAILRDETR
jgi:nucleoside-diphosphate-sugar epimerase